MKKTVQNNKLIENKKIAIIGGGMAGLTLARLLKMQNVEVKVFEREFDQNVRVQGSTLDLHEGTGLEAMKRAGLLEEFYKHHRVDASKMLLVDRSLHIKFDDHNFAKLTSETRPEIDRAPLRDILLNSLQANTVIWDSQFSSMEKENSGWRIHFKNGTNAYADFVVAADGARSKVRPYLSSVKSIYSGITLIQGDIDQAAKSIPHFFTFAKSGKVMAFDDEKMIGFGSKADGSAMFVTCFKCPDNWLNESGVDFKNKSQVVEWFKKEFPSWSDKWHELFANNEVHFIPRPQYYFPLDQQWETQDNLTMIGDAAHGMPPFAGEGANVAMQDSFELAEVLLSVQFSDIKTALAHFEKDMVMRGASATQQTLDNTEKMFAKNGLEQMVSFFKNVSE